MMTLGLGGGQRGNGARSAGLVGAERLKREVCERLDVRVGLGVSEVARRCGAILGDGLVFAAELGVKIAANQMEDGIGRIFFFERSRDFERLLVLLIVVVEADREGEKSTAR